MNTVNTERTIFFLSTNQLHGKKIDEGEHVDINTVHCNHCIKIYLANTISSLSVVEPSESPHGRWVLRCQGGRSKGCALVSFKSPEEARRAAGSP